MTRETDSMPFEDLMAYIRDEIAAGTMNESVEELVLTAARKMKSEGGSAPSGGYFTGGMLVLNDPVIRRS